jgi:iron transport multicopper oxidase
VDPTDVFAVLRYAGAPAAEPTTDTGFASGTKLQEVAIVPLENPGAPGLPVNGGVDKVFNLAFTLQGGNMAANTGVMWKVNGRAYSSPSVPTLLTILSGTGTTDADFVNDDGFVIANGDTVEINISGVQNPHPFHLQ